MRAIQASAPRIATAVCLLMALSFSSGVLAGPPAKEVEIVNDPAHPVPIEDVNTAALQPFQATMGIVNLAPLGGTIATAPAGQRLVIEFFSASCSSEEPSIEPTKIRVHLGGGIYHFFWLDNKVFGTGFSSTATHLTRMYVEPETDVELDVFPTTAMETISCVVSISGHLVET